jgi:putative FmdB family regulatory protein
MIYGYMCEDCEIEFTEMRKMAERLDPITCPACSGQGKFKIGTPKFVTSGGGHINSWAPGKGVLK